jgi:PAS domain S-box-containing protein/putative nucleotidyltransferase with HDIG domain
MENGVPTGFQAIARDITAQKKAEDALKASEEKFSKAFRVSPNAMSITSLSDGRYIEVNDSFLDMTGYVRQEVIGKTIRELRFWIDKKDPVTIMRSLAGNEAILNHETRIRLKSGAVHTVLVSVETIAIAGEKYALAVGTDITDRKEADSALRLSLEKLRKAMDMIIEAMALTVESRDPYTAGHQRRVANLARAIADEMRLPSDVIDGIRMAGVIHDLGKISIPAEILSKPGKLSDIEFNLIKVHPQAGYDILKRIEFPWPVADIVYQHHERINGSGYPLALKKDDIIVEARILAVADVVEAIASHRPYRSSLGIESALDEIITKRDVLYDAGAVDACVSLFREGRFSLE